MACMREATWPSHGLLRQWAMPERSVARIPQINFLKSVWGDYPSRYRNLCVHLEGMCNHWSYRQGVTNYKARLLKDDIMLSTTLLDINLSLLPFQETPKVLNGMLSQNVASWNAMTTKYAQGDHREQT